MGLGLGSLVDKSAGGVGGVPYLQFVVPGILAAQARWVAVGESTYQILGAIRWNMKYHAMLATPIGIDDILLGHLTYVAMQITGATAIFGGLTPYVAQLLVERTGWAIAPGAMIAIVGLCVLPLFLMMAETAPRERRTSRPVSSLP